MRDFKKFVIWNEGMNLVYSIYNLSQNLPENEKFGLVSQIRRAAVSIPSNIAEGCSRNSELDFKRFLEISLGSSYELETQLMICDELKFISKEKIEKQIIKLNSLQKQINSLISKIKISQKPATKG